MTATQKRYNSRLARSAVLALFLSSGCARPVDPKHDLYPATWRPVRSSADRCLDLNGNYDANGFRHTSDIHLSDSWCKEELLTLLFPERHVKPAEVSTLMIEQSSCGDVQAAAWTAAREVARGEIGPEKKLGSWRDGLALDFEPRDGISRCGGKDIPVTKTDSLFVRQDGALIGGFKRYERKTGKTTMSWCFFPRRASF